MASSALSAFMGQRWADAMALLKLANQAEEMHPGSPLVTHARLLAQSRLDRFFMDLEFAIEEPAKNARNLPAPR